MQVLAARLHVCMYVYARLRPVWAYCTVQQEDMYGWHLQARVMRRRSTGEDGRGRQEESVYARFVYVFKSFIRTDACAIGSTNVTGSSRKRLPQKYPATSDIATVGDGYQTVLHRD